MHTEEYTQFITEFLDDEVNLEISPALIKRLSNLSKTLEKEVDFTLDDVVGELYEILPAKMRGDSDVEYFINELGSLVIDEIQTQEIDEEDSYYEEEDVD